MSDRKKYFINLIIVCLSIIISLYISIFTMFSRCCASCGKVEFVDEIHKGLNEKYFCENCIGDENE